MPIFGKSPGFTSLSGGSSTLVSSSLNGIAYEAANAAVPPAFATEFAISSGD